CAILPHSTGPTLIFFRCRVPSANSERRCQQRNLLIPCQLAAVRPNYVPAERRDEDDHDEAVRLPESALIHFVLALVLVASVLRIRLQRRQSTQPSEAKRQQLLGLSIRRAGSGEEWQEVLAGRHTGIGAAVRVRL